MHRSIPTLITTLLCTTLLYGCLGSSSDDSSADNSSSSSSTVALTGTVVKGAVNGAQVRIYALNSDGSRGNMVAGPFATGADGSWSGKIPASELGPFEVVATGGSYTDEASNSSVTMPTGAEMLAVIPENPGSTFTAAVTPLTHAIAQSARKLVQDGVAVQNAARLAVKNAESLFGFDPSKVVPPDPLNVTATATAQQKQYAALLGGISRLGDKALNDSTAGLANASRLTLALAMADDLADGKLDGKGLSGSPIAVDDGSGSSQSLPALDSTGLQVMVTETNAFAGSQSNLSGTSISSLSGELSAPDGAAPVVTAPAAITVTVPAGSTPVAATHAEIAAFLSAATADDEIDGDLSSAISHDAPTSFPAGTTTVTFTVADAAGNSGSASADVTVVESNPNTSSYSISGSVTGLQGTMQIELLLGGAIADDRPGFSGSSFSFSNVADGSSYSINLNSFSDNTINCSVSNGSGTVNGADVSDIAITCSTAPISSGLAFDMSALEFSPSVPSGLNAEAPTTSPSDVTGSVASLYSALGNQLKADVFAAAPAGSVSNVADTITMVEQAYQIYEYDTLPNPSWARSADFRFGPDGQPLTADDLMVRYSMTPDYAAQVSFSFTHPGRDKTWFTQDDLMADSSSMDGLKVESGGEILAIGRLYPGEDRILFSGDETINNWGYEVISVDTNGNHGQVTHFDGEGSDGQWFTADDSVGFYVVSRFNTAGQSLQATTYNGAGSDGQWFTSDDTVDRYLLTHLDGNNRPDYMVTYNGAGLNGTWFDSDDQVGQITFIGYDADGRPLLTATHTSAGTDSTWFTGDDLASAVLELTDAQGHTIISASISAIGADGKWLSGDDTVSYYSFSDYDANGLQVRNAQFNGAGADGAWFTADDLPNTWNYWSKEYNANGQPVLQTYYSGPGADGLPFTADDSVSSYQVRSYDANGTQLASVNVTNLGADGIAMTSDDTLGYNYGITTIEGQTSTYIRYDKTPGSDGAWFTMDDPQVSYTVSTLDSAGNVIESTSYNDPGSDGVWQTADDVISGMQRSTTADASGSYELISYTGAGGDGDWSTTGDNVIGSYQRIDVDGSGRITKRLSYSVGDDATYGTADDVKTQVLHQSYDADGNITEYYVGYSAGSDGIWYTADDYPSYFSYSYDANGQVVSTSYWGTGSDGIYLNSDDNVEEISYQQPIDFSLDSVASNSGYSGGSCNSASTVSGTLNVHVNDIDGNPISGATVQLGQDGTTTATSDGSGLASFTTTGAKDVHVFMNDYSWESFYCVEADGTLDLYAQLQDLTKERAKSALPLQVSISNRETSITTNVMLALLDSNGKLLGQALVGQGVNSQTVAMTFNQPVGSTVTGELWAFEIGVYSYDADKVIDAVQVAASQGYTTVAHEWTVSNYTSPLATTVTLNASKPQRSVLGYPGQYIDPTGGTGYSKAQLAWGGVLAFPFTYDSSTYTHPASVPDSMPSTFSVDTLEMEASLAGVNWHYRQPLSNPTLPVTLDAQSSLLLPPQLSDVDGQGAVNPLFEWTAASQAKSGVITSMTTLEVGGYVSAVADSVAVWRFHLPPGEEQLVVPTRPAAITTDNLSNSSYQMWMRVDAVYGVDYQSLIAGQDIHQGLPTGQTVENFTTANSYYFTP